MKKRTREKIENIKNILISYVLLYCISWPLHICETSEVGIGADDSDFHKT